MVERWEYEIDQRGNRVGIWTEDKRFAYITNLQHSLVRKAYDQRCRQLGRSSLERKERVALDLELVERFGLDGASIDVRKALLAAPYMMNIGMF